jgi:hypothetical protein
MVIQPDAVIRRGIPTFRVTGGELVTTEHHGILPQPEGL